MSKQIIICDLDGTLCNCEHRVHHVRQSPKNWDAFYAGVKDDTVNEAVLRVLENFLDSDHWDYELIFSSGRPERCRADTELWLWEHGFENRGDRSFGPSLRSEDGYPYTLIMRKVGDYRPDYVVKQRMLDKYIDKERVLFAMDDRNQVVDMWRRNGITCFQVQDGNF